MIVNPASVSVTFVHVGPLVSTVAGGASAVVVESPASMFTLAVCPLLQPADTAAAIAIAAIHPRYCFMMLTFTRVHGADRSNKTGMRAVWTVCFLRHRHLAHLLSPERCDGLRLLGIVAMGILSGGCR